ncbi:MULTISPECIES: fimbria/pilus outer membrane usher protein [Rahnella]|uniref:fimbria/pilus outer membrane usher protein n=1 Tax=Rahnella TaxID=34037 RepID=UPI0010DDAED3|nr:MULTISPECIES: fimbria/pilus outer membrane usher protein [Rahnella]TCQ91465.1 outer membrane usher protein [Rahnella sp. JUb53]
MNRYYEMISGSRKNSFIMAILRRAVWSALLFSHVVCYAGSDTVMFNSAFMRSAIDVNDYAQGNPVLPGIHRVDLYINERWKGRTDVNFSLPDNQSKIAHACFNIKLLSELGIDSEKLDENVIYQLKDPHQCADINMLLPGLDVSYDVTTQHLNVTAPQIYLLRHARGYVSPELWDKGITAATLEYDYNAYHSEMSETQSISTQYLGLLGGINWDVWRLRYKGSFNQSDENGWEYDNASTYVERAIVPIRSKLVIGESMTEGQVFDSVGFRGAMLASDDRMYMDSQRGYAPVISGVANTTALVQISQRGTRIYETTVPPGSFVIDELYPTGTGGDLLVTVKEADGSERSFTVTYASIAELLRPGTTRYTLMSGTYRNSTVNEKPLIAMGTIRHGFTNLITGYGGVLGGGKYQSVAGGIALNTSLGAISSDITHARTQLHNEISKEGQSYSLAFSKILPVVNTNITLANYRYSSAGYYSIDDAMLIRDQQTSAGNAFYSSSINRKNRVQISATQDLSEVWGTLNISASTQDYWNRGGRDTEYQMGYTNTFSWFNLNINASRTRDLVKNIWDNKIAVGISLPLGSSANSVYFNSTYVQERDHQGIQNSVSGSAGDERQYTYSAFGNADHYSSMGNRNTAGASGNWNSPYTRLGGSFSAGQGYQQYGATLSGGAIAYGNGVVFTPIMGDTMAVVEANHASGAKVANNSSLALDKSGKAAVPYLTPYRQNSIELDPKGLSNDIALDVTRQNSVPTAGAVVLLKYETDFGYSALLQISSVRNEEIPFGTPVTDEKNERVGYIAQGSQSFIRVKKSEGKLNVKWGSSPSQQCELLYQLPADNPSEEDNLRRANVVCQ